MKRVCIVGNSHALAWLQAWTETSTTARGSFDITFFAARHMFLERLRAVNGQIDPASGEGREALAYFSSGHHKIDPSQYDAFIVVGIQLDLRYLASSCEQFGTGSQ